MSERPPLQHTDAELQRLRDEYIAAVRERDEAYHELRQATRNHPAGIRLTEARAAVDQARDAYSRALQTPTTESPDDGI